MKRIFILEEKDIPFDFQYQLRNAIDYQKWFNQEQNNYEFLFSEKGLFKYLSDNSGKLEYIPVGSLEFVEKYINHIGKSMKNPNFIPEKLRKNKFLKRKISFLKKADEKSIVQKVKSLGLNSFFIKDTENYKGFRGIINNLKNTKNLPFSYPKNILISEKIDIVSEYRFFVFNNEVVGLKNYNGDFKVFPNVKIVEEMVKEYQKSKDNFRAYTLDVAITSNNNTVLIEVHPFVSCGLYGFEEYKILPQMIISGYKDILK